MLVYYDPRGGEGGWERVIALTCSRVVAQGFDQGLDAAPATPPPVWGCAGVIKSKTWWDRHHFLIAYTLTSADPPRVATILGLPPRR